MLRFRGIKAFLLAFIAFYMVFSVLKCTKANISPQKHKDSERTALNIIFQIIKKAIFRILTKTEN